MAASTPLIDLHRRDEAPLLPYGPATAGVWLVDRFDAIELEYAAMRRSCVLLDLPSRGVIEVRGGDRRDFLDRMLTQRLSDQEAWSVRRSFWLNRKGRIDADLRVIELEDRTLLEVDIHACARTVQTLDAFVIADDVTIEDVSERVHRLAVHGPGGPALLGEIGDSAPCASLACGQACRVSIAGHEVIVARDDTTGDAGLELIVDVDDAHDVYLELLHKGGAFEEVDREGAAPVSAASIRRAGWHAYNVARLEAGTPLYLIDFGPDTLPHETSIVRDRIDFKKGCYLGQEVVARMDARGAMKQRLVGLRVKGNAQPATGAGVQVDGQVVGAVTSSTVSPMLGSATICLAMMKAANAAPDTTVQVEAEGEMVEAVVQDGLVFWSR